MLPEKLIPTRNKIIQELKGLAWEERLKLLEHLIQISRKKARAEIYEIEHQMILKKK